MLSSDSAASAELAGDALDSKLREADAGTPPATSQTEPAPAAPASALAPAPDAGEAFYQATTRYGAVARTMLPDQVRVHWTDARLHELGTELANCARHYGWTFGAALNHPLARLATVVAPLAWPIAWPLLEPRLKPYLQAFQGKPAPTPEAPLKVVMTRETPAPPVLTPAAASSPAEVLSGALGDHKDTSGSALEAMT